MSGESTSSDVRTLWRDLPAAGKVVLVSAVLGFVVRIPSESSRTVNGVVTDCSFTDLGAIAFGATAVGAGLLTLLAARSHHRRGLLIAVGVLGLAVGALHIARGVGTFHDCASDGVETTDPQDPADADADTTGSPGEVTTVVGPATSSTGATITYTVPEDWTISIADPDSPPPQRLSSATAPDGTMGVYGSVRGLTDEEVTAVPDELASSGFESTRLAGHPAWLIEETNATFSRTAVNVLVDDLQITLAVQSDPGPPRDQAAILEDILASLTVD